MGRDHFCPDHSCALIQSIARCLAHSRCTVRMWNEWERVFSKIKAKSRIERELIHLSFSLKNQNQGSGQADAQDFQVAKCSHVTAKGAQGKSPSESSQCGCAALF